MQDLYPIIVLSPLVGLIAYCASHVSLARRNFGRSPYASLAIGFICGFVIVVMVTTWTLVRGDFEAWDCTGYLVLDVMTYVALAFGYFNFVNLMVASLRIRILEELRIAGGCMSRASLTRQYDSQAVISARLDRLVRGGHIVERDGRFYRGRIGFLLVARVFDRLRSVIIGPAPPKEHTA